MKKGLKVVALVVIALILGVFAFLSINNQSDQTTGQDSASDQPANSQPEAPTSNQPGRYVDYSESVIGSEDYATILFFHAPWCPECRGFDQTIKDTGVPNGFQIVKVDYDSSTELRKKYGVTIQSSFVRVDSNGDKIKLWTGYGKDKSVSTIIENTK